MGRVNRLLVLAALCGCINGCGPRQAAYSTPGTLYVEFWRRAAANDGPQETTELRNGRAVEHLPVGLVVARDRPDRSFVDSDMSICTQGGTYQLSPDGTWALCSSPSGDQLRIFDPAHPKVQRVVLGDFYENANRSSFAWLDNNRFVALVLDKSCPYAHLYDFFPTRVVTFDRGGHRLSIGPCAFGVVAGERRVALLGERPNSPLWLAHQFLADDPRYYNDGYDRFHHTWSVDYGRTWHDGTPLAFDGDDNLLYSEPFSDIVRSERGQVAFKNVYSVQWSR